MSDIKLRLMSYRTGTRLLAVLPLACLLTACGPDYSPNTYMSNSVQQANKVDSGVVIGVRMVKISADATLGSATGGAAGGIAGSQAGTGAVSALTALGGAVAGGLVGNAVGHDVEDTYGYEYIVRKPKGDLVSITQKDEKPLKVGQRVLIIQGAQARLVSDYTEHVDTDDNDLAAPPNKAQSPNEPKPDLSKAAADEKSAPPPQTDSKAPAAETAPITEIAPATPTDTAPVAAPIAEQPAADPAKPETAPAAPTTQSDATPSAPSATSPTQDASPATTTNPATEDKASDMPKDDAKAPATETTPSIPDPGTAH